MQRSDIVVLVVDDDPAVRGLLTALIQARGYSFLAASNGREALTLARACPYGIQLLVSDVDMPQMDGLALATQITKEHPGIRILMISGNEQPRVTLPFLKKPFLPPELWRKLDQVLSGENEDSGLLLANHLASSPPMRAAALATHLR